MRIRPVNMEFLYGTAFLSQSPEAYERLILDAMRGDATLFTRDDEVEAQWRIIDPILESWRKGEPPLVEYAPGRRAPRRPTSCSSRATSGGRSGGVTDAGGIWSEQDTTPGGIEAAIRQLLQEQYARDGAARPRACSTSSSWSTASGAARSSTGSSASGATTRRG